MKNKIKNLSVYALLAAACVSMLAGCGSKKVSEGYWVLKEVSEDKETVKGDALEDYGLEESYIVTEKNGEGYAVLFGIPTELKINEDKGNIELETGKADYKVSGKKLTLSDSNMTMVFEKSKEDAPKKPKKVSLLSYSAGSGKKDSKKDSKKGSKEETGEEDYWDDEGDTGSETEEESKSSNDDPFNLSYKNPREFFEGDWYGWLKIDARTDFWKQIDGEVYDAVCRVEMKDDNFGTVTIWDAYSSYEEPFAKVDIVVNDKGTDPKKGLMCDDNSGFFLDGDFDMHNSWTVDPGAFEWSNYMMIASTYVDGNEQEAMDYVFHFKKWGDDWSDFSQKPPHYDWYKKLIDAGEPMPDKIPED